MMTTDIFWNAWGIPSARIPEPWRFPFRNCRSMVIVSTTCGTSTCVTDWTFKRRRKTQAIRENLSHPVLARWHIHAPFVRESSHLPTLAETSREARASQLARLVEILYRFYTFCYWYDPRRVPRKFCPSEPMSAVADGSSYRTLNTSASIHSLP